MRLLATIPGLTLFHIMAVLSSVFGLGPYYYRIFWRGGLDPLLTAALLILTFSPTFIVGVFTVLLSMLGGAEPGLMRMLFRSISNVIICVVLFIFTGVFVGLAVESLLGNSNYLFYVAWIGLTFPLHAILSSPLGCIVMYMVILLVGWARS